MFSVGSVRERLKIFFAVDTLLLCSLASALSHVALHLQFFCGNFFGNTFIVVWQDYMVMVLYIVTNFIMLGKFRISMLYVRWQVWQVVFLKVLLVFASLVYFAIEL